MATEDSTTSLVRYEAARQALTECARVDEAKEIRDWAVALAAYARQAKDRELEDRALEIRLRAERRAGELLRDTEKNPGARGNPGGRGARIVQSHEATAQPTLAELGVSKDQSSNWQRLAATPDRVFESALAAAKKAGERATTDGMLRRIEGRQQRRNANAVAFSQATDGQLIEYAAGRLPIILREVEQRLGLAAGCVAALLAHPTELQLRRGREAKTFNAALLRARLEVANSRHLSIETLREVCAALPETATRGHWVADMALVREIEGRLTAAAKELARAEILGS